ncbi:hypothetical protein OUZ56_001238 [Daphnia magna]|uniref:Uncharacterized protein n=1 Tax=Daphnia magna TaxID=35525 RepID=A0ABR0A223_9CRUS|nr:hypothetical protein OUZ56_001238 [Daphnia magna]
MQRVDERIGLNSKTKKDVVRCNVSLNNTLRDGYIAFRWCCLHSRCSLCRERAADEAALFFRPKQTSLLMKSWAAIDMRETRRKHDFAFSLFFFSSTPNAKCVVADTASQLLYASYVQLHTSL